MTLQQQHYVMNTLRTTCAGLVRPSALLLIDDYGKDPYLILVGCILSLRTRDVVSYKASKLLFSHAQTPQQMVRLSIALIENSIHSVGFFRRKAQQIQTLNQQLIDQWGGNVPASMEELLTLAGVGRKTANLVRGYGFDIPSICVDVHVHRLANQWGWVHTKTPEQTEYALMRLFDKKYWIELNQLLVMCGQNKKPLIFDNKWFFIS